MSFLQHDPASMLSSPTSYLRTPHLPGSSNASIISDTENSAPSDDGVSISMNVRCDVMIKFLRQRQLEKLWAYSTPNEGVVLKQGRNDFICQPRQMADLQGGFYDQVKALNVKCSMSVNTDVIQTFLQSSRLPYVPLADGLRLQVLPDISYLSKCKKHHFAAFIQDPGLLIVWDDDPENIIERAESIEKHLVGILWKNDTMKRQGSQHTLAKPAQHKGAGTVTATELADSSDLPKIEFSDAPRKTLIYAPVLTMIAALLCYSALGVEFGKLAIEVKTDRNLVRLALCVVAPAQIWLGWFFFQTVVTNLAQVIGPVNQLQMNSRSFSGVRTARLSAKVLPHVTIQCPVYKEGLWTVIDPTMASLRAAMSTYEMQGGSVNIFVNDDGMQLIQPNEARERREYYEEHNIGWVARPQHNPPSKKNPASEKTFIRGGKFKKASNMNYAMSVSARVEDRLAIVQREAKWDQEDEDMAYSDALSQVIEEDQGRTWAEGDVRIGDYILIIDSDTRVPSDCLLDAVSEMEASPQVAIIQFSSSVMNVTTSFFEKGITYFTQLVYTAISFAVSNGDVAPFVGHNAILRWSAIQDIAYLDHTDNNREKYWSETTVSEDFDMALRLQSAGYDLRFSTYYHGGFQEGVSLTVYDELARWQKYAYGCSELIFQPLMYWPTRGPFTPLFRRFMFSKMSVMAKFTIMSYVGTYFAIASAWPLSILNYFAIGWYNGYLDSFYLSSYNVWFGIMIVFQASGVVALAVFRYRTEGQNLFKALWENLTWLPLLTIFLGGISVHVSQAIVCHLLSIDMSWGATSKEAKRHAFFDELPTIIRKFKITFLFCVVVTAAITTLSGVGPVGAYIPYDWQITSFQAIFPLTLVVAFHFLLPLVLNPGLMSFTF